MKKIIISFFILFGVCGCWNYKELNDYAIANGMAIDYIDNKYNVSFLISNGKKIENMSNNSLYQSFVYSGSGDTISDAVNDIGLIIPKQLYIGQLSSIVISEEVAKNGLYDALEYLLEDSKSEKNFFVVLAKDSLAKDILSVTTQISDNLSESISNNIQSSNRSQGSIVSKTFNDIIYELVNDGIDTFISSYTIVGNKDMGVTNDDLESNEPKSYIKYDNLGIFKGDKLVGWADSNQSNGINIINNDVNELYLNIPCDDGYVVVNTTDLHSKKEIGKDFVKINTTGNAWISEVTCSINLDNEDNINELKKRIDMEIEKLINAGFMFARENKSDVFGFGLSYYKNNPKEYKSINWDDIYSKIGINVNVNKKKKKSGSLKKNIERIKDE